jgi:hypothetical protein
MLLARRMVYRAAPRNPCCAQLRYALFSLMLVTLANTQAACAMSRRQLAFDHAVIEASLDWVQVRRAARDAADAEWRNHKLLVLPPLGDCRADMTVAPGLQFLPTQVKRYNEFTIPAAGDRARLPAGFFRSKDQVVDDVLAIERAAPGMIPRDYFSLVELEPQNPDLRLVLARCELEHAQTRRRASYDAMLALLLGANRGSALAILMESTNNQYLTAPQRACDAPSACPDGFLCSPLSKYCVSATPWIDERISLSELAVEDALSRALIAPELRANELEAIESGWWRARRLHRCGGERDWPCTWTTADGQYVSRDLRDNQLGQ